MSRFGRFSRSGVILALAPVLSLGGAWLASDALLPDHRPDLGPTGVIVAPGPTDAPTTKSSKPGGSRDGQNADRGSAGTTDRQRPASKSGGKSGSDDSGKSKSATGGDTARRHHEGTAPHPHTTSSPAPAKTGTSTQHRPAQVDDDDDDDDDADDTGARPADPGGVPTAGDDDDDDDGPDADDHDIDHDDEED